MVNVKKTDDTFERRDAMVNKPDWMEGTMNKHLTLVTEQGFARPTRFADHWPPVSSCGCESCWMERAAKAERKALLDAEELEVERLKVTAMAEIQEKRREWMSDEISLMRTWAGNVVKLMRLPITAWAAVELARVIVGAIHG